MIIDNTTNHKNILDQFGELYTPEELAEYLKVSPSTVYNWAKTHKLECHVISKGKRKTTIRFDREQIQKLVESRNEN